MPPDWVYHLFGIVLVIAHVASWVATLFLLPGNWIIVAVMALVAIFLPEADTRTLGVGWGEVITLAGLAGVGELAEFVSGAAGAKKVGASRRSVALSLIGAVGGSILGAAIGLPVPVVGSVVAALVGGSAGAFGGAYLGEAWKGREHDERVTAGRVAAVGRLLGTVGKLVIGLIMVVIATAMFWVI